MTLADEIRALKLTGHSPMPVFDSTWNAALDRAAALAEAHESALVADRDHQRENKDQAYRERNTLVALLASLFPAGIARTEIEGWDPEWHGCVYIDFPWGQASWHYHDSQADLFAHLPPYAGSWDGHTTEAKYDAIMVAAKTGTALALVAAAIEAAADACADYPRIAPDATEVQHYDEQIDHSQACIGAMTPADASAALDRMLTEAWKRGMREAAGMATSFLVGHPGEGVPMRSPTPHEIKRRILAAAEKESGNG